MKNWLIAMSLGWLTLLSATAFSAAPPTPADPEETAVIAIADVPPVVLAKAKEALPDAYFKQASWVLDDDFRVYRLSGSYFRQAVVVHVREDAKLLRVERDNRDD